VIGFGHAATQPVKDTIFRVLASKRRAELAPVVGRDTDLMVLGPSGAVRLPDTALAKSPRFEGNPSPRARGLAAVASAACGGRGPAGRMARP
jgi:hypothetical protein